MAATTLSDLSGFLTPAQSAPIFQEAARVSAVQQLARQIPLGISGATIPVVTSKPTATWVAEGAKKSSTSMGLGPKSMQPKKLACIVVDSAEVVRANPANYSEILRVQLGEAFGQAFDDAVLHDGGPFDHYLDETTKSVTLGTTTKTNGGLRGDIVAGLKLLVDDDKRLTGFAFDDTAEPEFLNAVDNNGRPIWSEDANGDSSPLITPGRLIGRRAFMAEGISDDDGTVLGYGGDWSKVAWGAASGISLRVSTEGTVTIDGTLTSLLENNLVAVVAEAEYGVVIADTAYFVKYLAASGS